MASENQQTIVPYPAEAAADFNARHGWETEAAAYAHLVERLGRNE